MILYMVNIYIKKTLKRVLESFKSALMTDCNQAVLLHAGTHNRGSVKKKTTRAALIIHLWVTIPSNVTKHKEASSKESSVGMRCNIVKHWKYITIVLEVMWLCGC